jgi:uncharacterized membrane protein (DUF4010 family)
LLWIRTTLRDVEPLEPHLSLLAALAVGLLIGLEREQAKPDTGGTGFGGIRTYPIFSLIGGLSMMVGRASMWVPLVALLGVIILVALAYLSDLKAGRDHGMTTEVSVIATFLLGALATSSGVLEPMSTRLVLVIAVGVTLTFLLSSKQVLHGFAARISREDLFSTVKFLIVATIVLPMLPREPMGPLDAINPFSVGLMVVLISGLSFAGFVAMRLLGQRKGLLLSAAVGGLVSSTAVTIAFATRTKQDKAMAPAAAGAIAIASSIMIARVGVLVAITNRALLAQLAVPLAGAFVGCVVGGLLVYRRNADATDAKPVEVKNPFELGSAVRFGLAFALIVFVTKAAKTYLGNQGLYLAGLIAGTTDVDAVTLSTAKQAGADLTPATIAILIAVASNTIVKSSIATAIGGSALGKRAFIVGGLTIAGAAAGAATTLALF